MSVDLSIIILSYNTRELTKRCILTLIKSLPKSRNFTTELIILDNASTDNSKEIIKNIKNRITADKNNNLRIVTIFNNINTGFAKGNNQALKIAKGKYILYLNSDVIVQDINFEKLISFLNSHSAIGALTVKVFLPDGKIDPASHRGFPTLSSSFFYFSGLEKLSKNIPYINKTFGKYHLVERSLNNVHEIDSPSGAFFLTRKAILHKLGGFDERFFFYGEDLDLSIRIKELGYKIIYYPAYRVLHLKHASSGEGNKNKKDHGPRYHFYDAMKIFYRKHYEKTYNPLVNKFVYFLLDFLKNKHA